MVKLKRVILFFLVCLSLVTSGCEDVDVMLATEASIDAIKAVSLSEDEVRSLATQTSQLSDSQNRLAPSGNKYSKRLRGLSDRYIQQDGFSFDLKVYLSSEVNAFAMADGTIRVYSGLMDMMNDGELLFVLGHEMGHVEKKHISKKIRLAYAGRAVRKGAASINNEIGVIARSQLGGFAEQLFNAQFSQHEEREADDYGLSFLKSTKNNPMAAVSALRKLVTLGSNHSFLSTHPAPGRRAIRLEAQLKQNS